MNTRTPLSLVIALPPWRTPEYPIGTAAALEEVCRGMKPDRVHWPALMDRLIDDGLTNDEAAARLRHLADEARQSADLTRAMAMLCDDAGGGRELLADIMGDGPYQSRAVPVYVVPGQRLRRVHGLGWLERWQVATPCVIVGSWTVRVRANWPRGR